MIAEDTWLVLLFYVIILPFSIVVGVTSLFELLIIHLLITIILSFYFCRKSFCRRKRKRGGSELIMTVVDPEEDKYLAFRNLFNAEGAKK